MKPHIVYYREKERKNSAGEFLVEKLDFLDGTVKNELAPFECLIDGYPCKCKVKEYIAYQATRKRGKKHKINSKIIS